MSTDFLRFPSGATVAQIKKDAKRLAKAQSIPLHAALDALAAQNGLPLSWHKALAHLRQAAAPLFRINLTINPEIPNRPVRHVMDVFPHDGPIFVLGGMGTGKSVLATHLAAEALDSGATAVRIISTYAGGSDLAGQRLHGLERRHGKRIQQDTYAPQMDLDMPAGALLILDEYTHDTPVHLPRLYERAAEKCFAVAVITQDARTLLPDFSIRHAEENSPCAIFVGATPRHLAENWLKSTDSRDIRAAIGLATTINPPSSEGCDFVVLTTVPGWVDVVRIT